MARRLHAWPPQMLLPFGPGTHEAPEESAELPEIVSIEELSAHAIEDAAHEIEDEQGQLEAEAWQ